MGQFLELSKVAFVFMAPLEIKKMYGELFGRCELLSVNIRQSATLGPNSGHGSLL